MMALVLFGLGIVIFACYGGDILHQMLPQVQTITALCYPWNFSFVSDSVVRTGFTVIVVDVAWLLSNMILDITNKEESSFYDEM